MPAPMDLAGAARPALPSRLAYEWVSCLREAISGLDRARLAEQIDRRIDGKSVLGNQIDRSGSHGSDVVFPPFSSLFSTCSFPWHWNDRALTVPMSSPNFPQAPWD